MLKTCFFDQKCIFSPKSQNAQHVRTCIIRFGFRSSNISKNDKNILCICQNHVLVEFFQTNNTSGPLVKQRAQFWIPRCAVFITILNPYICYVYYNFESLHMLCLLQFWFPRYAVFITILNPCICCVYYNFESLDMLCLFQFWIPRYAVFITILNP